MVATLLFEKSKVAGVLKCPAQRWMLIPNKKKKMHELSLTKKRVIPHKKKKMHDAFVIPNKKKENARCLSLTKKKMHENKEIQHISQI